MCIHREASTFAFTVEGQQDKNLSLRVDANKDAIEVIMIYEGIGYAIRAGLGRLPTCLSAANRERRAERRTDAGARALGSGLAS